MSFLTALEAIVAYVVIGTVLVLAGLTAWIEFHGLPSLLDGTPLQSVLDDRDRGFLVDKAIAEDREVAWLDSVWDLPSREPRA